MTSKSVKTSGEFALVNYHVFRGLFSPIDAPASAEDAELEYPISV